MTKETPITTADYNQFLNEIKEKIAWYMRQLYLEYKDYPNPQQLVGEMPWGQSIAREVFVIWAA